MDSDTIEVEAQVLVPGLGEVTVKGMAASAHQADLEVGVQRALRAQYPNVALETIKILKTKTWYSFMPLARSAAKSVLQIPSAPLSDV